MDRQIELIMMWIGAFAHDYSIQSLLHKLAPTQNKKYFKLNSEMKS